MSHDQAVFAMASVGDKMRHSLTPGGQTITEITSVMCVTKVGQLAEWDSIFDIILQLARRMLNLLQAQSGRGAVLHRPGAVKNQE